MVVNNVTLKGGIITDEKILWVANTSNTQLDQVLNGSGAPGIYDSSTTPDAKYGEYNCQSLPSLSKSFGSRFYVICHN